MQSEADFRLSTDGLMAVEWQSNPVGMLNLLKDCDIEGTARLYRISGYEFAPATVISVENNSPQPFSFEIAQKTFTVYTHEFKLDNVLNVFKLKFKRF